MTRRKNLDNPIQRVDDLGEFANLPHAVSVDPKPGVLIIRTYRECQAWLNDPINGSRGRHGVILDDLGRGLAFYFSDDNTAFWFKMRWSGAH